MKQFLIKNIKENYRYKYLYIDDIDNNIYSIKNTFLSGIIINKLEKQYYKTIGKRKFSGIHNLLSFLITLIIIPIIIYYSYIGNINNNNMIKIIMIGIFIASLLLVFINDKIRKVKKYINFDFYDSVADSMLIVTCIILGNAIAIGYLNFTSGYILGYLFSFLYAFVGYIYAKQYLAI
jgi:hypothetical protein